MPFYYWVGRQIVRRSPWDIEGHLIVSGASIPSGGMSRWICPPKTNVCCRYPKASRIVLWFF